MLSVRRLQMLAELERLGTITKVAESLHLAAPGVSMQLAALERELGLTLTERHGRGLVLTPAGQVLARHGRDLVSRMTSAQMDAASLREGTTGTYRVAAFPTAARTIVVSAWRTLLTAPAAWPEIRLTEMEPQDALPALDAAEADLVIAHAYSNMPPISARGMVSVEIAAEPVLLAVPPGDPRARDARAADLGEMSADPWIVPHRQWSCFEMVQRACAAAGFTPRAVAQSTDFTVQLALVGAGVGVALIPALALHDVPAGVTVLPLRRPVFRHVFTITRESSSADAGLRRLGQLLASCAAALVPAER